MPENFVEIARAPQSPQWGAWLIASVPGAQPPGRGTPQSGAIAHTAGVTTFDGEPA